MASVLKIDDYLFGGVNHDTLLLVDRTAGEHLTLEDLNARLAAPIAMLLFCPRCNAQHIDKADEVCGECGGRPSTCEILGHRPPHDRPEWAWKNPPHATHQCANCGLLWRPSNSNTTGVATIPALEPKHALVIEASFGVVCR